MPKIKLTIGRIAEAQCPKNIGQMFLWDSETPGLAVRATHGSQSFIFQKKLGGQTIRVTIGDVRAWPLLKVREEARRLQRLIDQGIDPRGERAYTRASREKVQYLVLDLWQLYIDNHPRCEDFPGRKDAWSDRHRQDHIYQGAHILKPLLEKKIEDIDTKTLIAWVDVSLGQGRDTAVRQGFLKLRAMWRWAYGCGEFGTLADPSMFSTKDLTNRIPSAGVKNDVLHVGQMKEWFEAVRAIPNRVISVYLQCLLLTGARRRELSSLRWSDVNMVLKSIHLHDKVNKVSGRTIPLTPYCMFLIKTLPKISDFVFSSPLSKSRHIEEPSIAHKRALASAGLLSISLHGLRRTFATIATEYEDMPAGVAAQLMGHKPSATAEKHYIKRSLDTLHKWHAALEAWILEQAGVQWWIERV